MLDQKTFLQGINYLKANYINWGFDLNNDLMIKVWFKKFSNLEPQTFISIVEKYTELNKFPPNSPADLIELIRLQLTQQELDANEAWALIQKLYVDHFYSYSKIYADIEDKPALYHTLKTFERELSLYGANPYIINAFKKHYENTLKGYVESKSNSLLGSNVLFLK